MYIYMKSFLFLCISIIGVYSILVKCSILLLISTYSVGHCSPKTVDELEPASRPEMYTCYGISRPHLSHRGLHRILWKNKLGCSNLQFIFYTTVHWATSPGLPANMAKKGFRFTARAKHRKPYCRQSSPVSGFVPSITDTVSCQIVPPPELHKTLPVPALSHISSITTPQTDGSTYSCTVEKELVQAIAQLSLANSQLASANTDLTQSNALLVAQIIELSRNKSMMVSISISALCRMPLIVSTYEGIYQRASFLRQSPGSDGFSNSKSFEC